MFEEARDCQSYPFSGDIRGIMRGLTVGHVSPFTSHKIRRLPFPVWLRVQREVCKLKKNGYNIFFLRPR
jgi:hypothetical protein